MSLPNGEGEFSLGRLARSLRQRLEVNRLFGWDVPLSRGTLEPGPLNVATSRGPVNAPAPSPPPESPLSASAAVSPSQAGEPSPGVASGRRNEDLLEPLRRRVASCTSCPLHEGRTNTVFGVGHPDARVLFVGEGPGSDEDRQGEPFVGKAGQLLNRMIKAMGFERRDVYIANVVKCRPPGNRDPLPHEICACRGYLEEQISIVAPEVIVALGATAARALLGGGQSMARMRARFHDFRGVPVMPTYHPAYLLRYPDEKRKVWDDLQQVMARLNVR